MGYVFICRQCRKKRGCNPTDDPKNFRECHKCLILRDICFAEGLFEKKIGGLCYICTIANFLRNRKITQRGGLTFDHLLLLRQAKVCGTASGLRCRHEAAVLLP